MRLANIRGRLPIICAAAFLCLAIGMPALAAAKQKKITGKLSQGGYTVIALAQNGEAKTDRAPNGEFKLRPPAKKVTLHLRAADGSYAGPIVVGTRKSGKRAIVGVYAGAKLGQVKVKSVEGYANVKLRKKWVDAKREARANKGVPIGAGNFGRVHSKKTEGGAPGDLDLDGVADPLDIDDDGDKVLDNLDRNGALKFAARPSPPWPKADLMRKSPGPNSDACARARALLPLRGLGPLPISLQSSSLQPWKSISRSCPATHPSSTAASPRAGPTRRSGASPTARWAAWESAPRTRYNRGESHFPSAVTPTATALEQCSPDSPPEAALALLLTPQGIRSVRATS